MRLSGMKRKRGMSMLVEIILVSILCLLLIVAMIVIIDTLHQNSILKGVNDLLKDELRRCSCDITDLQRSEGNSECYSNYGRKKIDLDLAYPNPKWCDKCAFRYSCVNKEVYDGLQQSFVCSKS